MNKNENKNEKKTDKEREEQRCGGCDCFEDENGCECRVVSCSNCGERDNLYNMCHPEFHSDLWFSGLVFEEKLSTIICQNCDRCYESEEENYSE
jgi:hypothetical protein